jgi:putative transposase
LSHKQRIELIEKNNNELSIKRQAELLDISRSSIYYQPLVNLEDQRIMAAIDKIYTRHPFKGSRRIKRDLRKPPYFIIIGREKTQRLMRLMAIEAIYPKPNTSKPDKEHFIYPNLIKKLIIDQPDLVWATDITYIRLSNSWAYLVAIMDWFSRYVVAWQLSPRLETDFCLLALENSLNKNRPEYFHSDQGSQFTSKEFTDKLKEEQIKISMSSKGRCHDNIFVERLWRTVKYEDIYLKHYADIKEAEKGLKEYFHFYNFERNHSSLNDKTPAEVYFQNKSQLVNFSLKTSGNVSLNSNFAVQTIQST